MFEIPDDGRRTPPPYSRQIWTERRTDYTVCGICNRVILLAHGPVCTACKAPIRAAKKARRKLTKSAKGAATHPALQDFRGS